MVTAKKMDLVVEKMSRLASDPSHRNGYEKAEVRSLSERNTFDFLTPGLVVQIMYRFQCTDKYEFQVDKVESTSAVPLCPALLSCSASWLPTLVTRLFTHANNSLRQRHVHDMPIVDSAQKIVDRKTHLGKN